MDPQHDGQEEGVCPETLLLPLTFSSLPIPAVSPWLNYSASLCFDVLIYPLGQNNPPPLVFL